MDVLCLGHTSWDISLFLDDYPTENSKQEIHAMLEAGGGPAGNAAYLLSKWGVRCSIAAAVGADAYGERITTEFQSVGTDTSCLERNPGHATPVSVILVNLKNGSRTIVNRKSVRCDGGYALPMETLKNASPKVMLFDGHELEASLQAMEMFPNALTILDAGSLRDGTRELAKRVDYLVSSERFAKQITGLANLDTPENQAQAISSLYSYNGNRVVITRGEKESLYGRPGELQQIPAMSVPVADTTAAGDIFHGAFAYGVLQAFPIQEALRFATTAAGLSVQARGGRASIPTLADVQETLYHAG